MADLSLRAVNALVVRTYLAPDEYFQALEPAHLAVFRSGELPWEYADARVPLRSWLCALPSAVALIVIRLILGHSAGPRSKLAAPRLAHSSLAARADAGVHACASQLLGHEAAMLASAHLFLSWFACDVLVRTPPSSLGACLSGAAMAHWPWTSSKHARWSSFALTSMLAALSGAVHPPAAVPWAVLMLERLVSLRGRQLLAYISVIIPSALLSLVRSPCTYDCQLLMQPSMLR
jgi:phosphatidylinositol glycan class B